MSDISVRKILALSIFLACFLTIFCTVDVVGFIYVRVNSRFEFLAANPMAKLYLGLKVQPDTIRAPL